MSQASDLLAQAPGTANETGVGFAPPTATQIGTGGVVPPTSTSTLVPKTPDNFSDLGAGIMGAGNGLLFGLPEFVYRRLGHDQAFKDFIANHGTAYNTGNLAGSIGSAFIPGIGLAGKAIGVGAKALEGAKLLDAGTQAAKAAGFGAKLLPFIGKGALYGGVEGGVRGLFGSDVGQELQGAASGVGQGAEFGALGGAAGGLISEAAPSLAQILKKGSEKAVIGTTDAKARSLLQMVREMTPPGSGPGAQLAHSDDLRERFVDFIKTKKLWQEGAIEKEYEAQKAVWNKLDDAFDSVAGNKKASEVLTGALSPEDTATLSNKYGPEVLQEAQKIVLDSMGENTGMANIRAGLKNAQEFARKKPISNPVDIQVANAVHDVSSTVRANLDDMIVKVAEGIPGGPKIPTTFRSDWGLLQPLEKGTLKADWTPAAGGLGSNTFPKMAVSAMLPGGMGVSGLVSGSPDTDIGTRLGNAALGVAGGYALQKGMGKLGVKGAALMNTLANKLPGFAEKMAANPGTGAAIGGGLGSLLAGQPTPPPAAGAGAVMSPGAPVGPVEQDPVSQQRLSAGIDLHWMQTTQGMWGPPGPSNKEYMDFRNGILTGLRDNGQSPTINPRLAAGIMFQDPDQKAAYLKALEARERISSAMPAAEPTFGRIGSLIGGIGKPEATAARGSIMDAVKGIAGGDKALESSVNRILNNSSPPDVKFKKIMDILKTARPTEFQALSQGAPGA